MMSLEQMADRLEIQDLLVRYCDAIDRKDFGALDDVFTPDAEIDYTATGGQKGDLTFIKEYLGRALEPFPMMQHMVGLPLITLEGDAARCRTILFNPMAVEKDGVREVFFVGAWYVDELVRTASGWRIRKRSEEGGFFHNLPAWFQPAP